MRRGHFTRMLAAAGAGLLIPAGLAGTALAGPAAHGTISTVIGGPGGPDPATSVSVMPCALKFANGDLYFSSHQGVVDRVSQRTGLLTPIAGDGVTSFGEAGPKDGTPAPAATLPGPCGVAVDGAGNVLVAADGQVLAVAAKTGTFYGKRMAQGRVYTLTSGFAGIVAGEGGISGGAVDVQLNAQGNLVIAVAGTASSHTDPEGDSRVFVYAEHAATSYGKTMVKGRLYQIGGSLNDYMLLNAVPATRADLGVDIGTVRLDPAGNVVIADQGGQGDLGPDASGPTVASQVRVIANRAGTFYGQRMKAGYIYTIAGDGTKAGDGVPATDANLQGASAVAFDHAGNVLVAAGAVRVIAAKNGISYGQKMTAHHIYSLPGFGKASNQAVGVAVDSAGNVLVSRSQLWDIRMLAGKTGSFYGKNVKAGQTYQIAGNGRQHYSGNGGPATSAELEPVAVATLRSGTMTAVVDPTSSVVRVVPARTGVFFGTSMRAGFIYTVAGTGRPGLSGDGGPGTQAALGLPDSVAFDPQGNVLVSDLWNHQVRVVATATGPFYGQAMTAGHIYAVAGGGTQQPANGMPARDVTFDGPVAVATDPAGDVLIIDGSGFESASQVWMVPARTGTSYGQAMAAGDIYLVAGDGKFGQTGDGGPATQAEIESQGLAVDGNGNVVLADADRVRVVAARTGTQYGQPMTAGDIYLVAGGGTRTGDGTPALQARLPFFITRIAVDPAGNLLAGGDSVVDLVAERAGSFYGKAAHAGDVYTVASGTAGLLGDGGPAANAAFEALGLAVQPGTGNLLIADGLTNRVRSVSR